MLGTEGGKGAEESHEGEGFTLDLEVELDVEVDFEVVSELVMCSKAGA